MTITMTTITTTFRTEINVSILKIFQCFISHVTESETEMKLFQPLKLLHNYLGDIEHVGKYS